MTKANDRLTRLLAELQADWLRDPTNSSRDIYMAALKVWHARKFDG